MRSGRLLMTILVAIALSAGTGFAMKHEASAEKGKALFNDPKLGTNGKSCNDCHPNGKDMEKAANNPGLPKVINGCITQPLNGKALNEKSVEMQSLILYIKNVGGSGKAAPRKPPVGC